MDLEGRRRLLDLLAAGNRAIGIGKSYIGRNRNNLTNRHFQTTFMGAESRAASRSEAASAALLSLLAPMRFFAIGVERPLSAMVHRPQHADSGVKQRSATFGPFDRYHALSG
jgi:hypothetical protein